MKAVSVITTPPKDLSVASAHNSFEVKRGNVVAVVVFPTFTVVKYHSSFKSHHNHFYQFAIGGR
jgi:hypothetical protein